MNTAFVLKLYQHLQSILLPIWIDGGWCVDALLGQEGEQLPQELGQAAHRGHDVEKIGILLSEYQSQNEHALVSSTG